MKFDLQQSITNTIVAQIEKGTAPWVKPWNAANNVFGVPVNHAGKPYRGINVLLLWGSGFSGDRWMTYKQASAAGAQVRKGESGTQIVWAGKVPKKDNPEETYFSLKYYTVFNETQVDGLPQAPAREPIPADPFFDSIGADVRHRGGQAFYNPNHDFIQLPHPGDFASLADYQATKAHEFCHWSGSETRLDRLKKTPFGSPDYAFEELVAELGSAFLCAHLGLHMEPRPDHASYIEHWLQKLKSDKKFIFKAAADASKAVEFLIELSTQKQELTAGLTC